MGASIAESLLLRIAVVNLAVSCAGAATASAASILLTPDEANTLIQVAGPDVQQLSNGLGDIYQPPARISNTGIFLKVFLV